MSDAHIAFVAERLQDMRARPLMWSWNQAAFILQLTLLAEVALLPARRDEAVRTMMRELGNFTSSMPDGRLTEEWAVSRVDMVRAFINRHSAPDASETTRSSITDAKRAKVRAALRGISPQHATDDEVDVIIRVTRA